MKHGSTWHLAEGGRPLHRLPPRPPLTGGNVYFSAGVPDAALWRSDGTAAGTLQLAPVGPKKITVVASRLLFAGYDGTHGTRLWSSDGTAGGTAVIKDVYHDERAAH